MCLCAWQVAEHITTSRRHSLQLQVWGSSIGWLLLYGALTCHLQTYGELLKGPCSLCIPSMSRSVASAGYEILKPLAKFSAELVRRHEVRQDTCWQ